MILDGLPVSVPLTKGHGTENDFVIVPDPDGGLEITPGQVAKLCDRRAGIGADGVLRVVRTAKMPGYEDQASEAEYFMDYRNADGSVAEMCGNGVRVFALYLVESGLEAGPQLVVGSRAGARPGGVYPDPTAPVPIGPGRGPRRFPAPLAGRDFSGAPCGQ